PKAISSRHSFQAITMLVSAAPPKAHENKPKCYRRVHWSSQVRRLAIISHINSLDSPSDSMKQWQLPNTKSGKPQIQSLQASAGNKCQVQSRAAIHLPFWRPNRTEY